MDLFSYILILTSVIYALAIAQILEGLSRLTQSSATIRSFLPHSIWVLNLFVFIFLVWWATWEFRDIEWSFPKYVYMLIAPTALFFTCSLLLPIHVHAWDFTDAPLVYTVMLNTAYKDSGVDAVRSRG